MFKIALIDRTCRPDILARWARGIASLARHRQDAGEWERGSRRPDPDEFTRKILPLLQGVPISRMVQATGLSLRYCSLIRRGLYVPHPRHWRALRDLERTHEDSPAAPSL